MSEAIVVATTTSPMFSGDDRSRDDKAIDLWLHGRPESTQRAYRRDVVKLLTFVRKSIATITLADLQAFADSLTGAPVSRARTLNAVKSLLGFLCRAGVLPVNVGAALRIPKSRDTLADRILSRAETKKLLKVATDPRDYALVAYAYESGFRRAELRARHRDVAIGDGGDAFVTVVGKGGKTRTVRIRAATWALVAALRAPDVDGEAPLFPGRDRSRPLSASQIWRIVSGLGRKAKLPRAISPHFLRHSHASHALDRGAPIALVRDTLGHSSVAVTDRYLHARPKESSGKYLGL
ncbi:MAG: tyrosine-type recombinase/integrase [Vulcanimicrobiaceae bacterium]